MKTLMSDAYEELFRFHIPGFVGYAARFPPDLLNWLQNHHDVDFIEQDRTILLDTFETKVQTKCPAWGLKRIARRQWNHNDSTYIYPESAGTGVDAYIIDTGVFIAHPEFEGRARVGKSFTKDGDKDGNGHGTHVAGTIGSKTYGVAKNVNIIAVKVLDSQGSGTTSGVIAGIEWAAKQVAAKKNKKRKSVANMSLGGGASAALDKAVKGATTAGLTFAVAAGNSGNDACLLSPARVPSAITVAASDINDKLAYFSEKGKCVDIIAPGVDILSTWNNGKTNIISGTSMATPHVAGVVALALAEGDFETVKEVHDYIKQVSTKDIIAGSLKGAPNNFLYNQVIGGGFPDDEPKEPKVPDDDEPDQPDEPTEGECPIPQCLFDPACTSCCVDC
jgi:cerevisin